MLFQVSVFVSCFKFVAKSFVSSLWLYVVSSYIRCFKLFVATSGVSVFVSCFKFVAKSSRFNLVATSVEPSIAPLMLKKNRPDPQKYR